MKKKVGERSKLWLTFGDGLCFVRGGRGGPPPTVEKVALVYSPTEVGVSSKQTQAGRRETQPASPASFTEHSPEPLPLPESNQS